MEITEKMIEADILHKLHRKRKWGASHTAFENIYKSCDKNYIKMYKEAGGRLIRNGFIIPKPTHYGLQISLNHKRRNEIIEIIHRFFTFPA